MTFLKLTYLIFLEQLYAHVTELSDLKLRPTVADLTCLTRTLSDFIGVLLRPFPLKRKNIMAHFCGWDSIVSSL